MKLTISGQAIRVLAAALDFPNTVTTVESDVRGTGSPCRAKTEDGALVTFEFDENALKPLY